MNDDKKLFKEVIPLTPERSTYWRDELNFAEFPLASLDSKATTKSLVFEDQIFDRGSNELVTRRLTVAPSTEYGLPTAMDEEILLGLIQLTSKQRFTSRTIYFTRYELIQELGLKDHSDNYRRIEEALNKWIGVTLYYDNAWWNKEEQSWVSEKFHVLESVTLLGRERRKRRMQGTPGDQKAGLSSFTWNEHVFKSFEAGYLKKLDFDLYTSLQSNIAKRIYRFLDKKFYMKEAWNFDLKRFACEHVGLSKNYSNAKLKERLRAAIEELVEKGFLTAMPLERRYKQIRRGEWKIFFVRGEAKRNTSKKDAALTYKKPSSVRKVATQAGFEFIEVQDGAGQVTVRRVPKKKAANG